VTVWGLRKDRAAARSVLVKHGLWPVVFRDSDNGGATDAYHTIGFGTNLGSGILPSSSMGLPCTLRHFLDGGATGSFPDSVRVVRSLVPVVIDKGSSTSLPANNLFWGGRTNFSMHQNPPKTDRR